MRIAITSQGKTPTDAVDPRFGRATCFLIHDNATGTWQTVDNAQSVNQAQGAGIQAAQTLAGATVDVLITGHCGPRAFRALQAADIQVVTGAAGTVAEAVEAFQRGDLTPTTTADVEAHW